MIKRYEILIVHQPAILAKNNVFEITNMKVLAENKKLIVFDNDQFKIIAKQKSWIYSQINKPTIVIYTNDSCYGNSVKYILYTDKNKRNSTIKKEIEKKLNDKYGWLIKELDLNFITNK